MNPEAILLKVCLAPDLEAAIAGLRECEILALWRWINEREFAKGIVGLVAGICDAVAADRYFGGLAAAESMIDDE